MYNLIEDHRKRMAQLEHDNAVMLLDLKNNKSGNGSNFIGREVTVSGKKGRISDWIDGYNYESKGIRLNINMPPPFYIIKTASGDEIRCLPENFQFI